MCPPPGGDRVGLGLLQESPTFSFPTDTSWVLSHVKGTGFATEIARLLSYTLISMMLICVKTLLMVISVW